jgi:hypothetical protein
MIEENNTADAVHILQEASDLSKAAGVQPKVGTILEAEIIGSAAFYREVAAVRLSNSLTQRSSGMLMFKAIFVRRGDQHDEELGSTE